MHHGIGEKSKRGALSAWQETKSRIKQHTQATSSSTRKKLFEGKLDEAEEKNLREMMLPILLPKLFQKEDFQTSQSIKKAKARFDEIPVVDLQKTASSLNSELDWANMTDLSDELDFLDVTEEDVGECDDTYSGGSTSGRSSGTGMDTTRSAQSTFFSCGAFLGPLPEMDTIDLFLAKQVNESQIMNVSTDDSVIEISHGHTSDQIIMEIQTETTLIGNTKFKRPKLHHPRFYYEGAIVQECEAEINEKNCD